MICLIDNGCKLIYHDNILNNVTGKRNFVKRGYSHKKQFKREVKHFKVNLLKRRGSDGKKMMGDSL